MDPILIILIGYGVVLGFFGIWSFCAMASDKSAAENYEWRTSECKLHLLELLGGWFGSLCAQLFCRHKIKKCSYQIVFWIIVGAHAAAALAVYIHREEIRKLWNGSE